MKITIKVSDVVTEIETGIKDYEKEYEKLLKLYLEKVEKYTEYVKKEIQNHGGKGGLQQSPYAPTWLRDNFVQTLNALKAHTKEIVVMDDREYSEIHSGIQRLQRDITVSTASLNAVTY